MTERLTKREYDGSVGISALRYYNYDDFQKMTKKLAHYEDLEEQDRLMVLPEGFDKEKLFKALAHEQCPAHFGLPIINCDYESCKECWEKALKGE